MLLATIMFACLGVCPDPYTQDGFNTPVSSAELVVQDGYLPPPPPLELLLHVDPEPEPEPIRQASSSQYRGMGSDVAQWAPLVAGHFGDLGQDAVDMAMRIMACESGGNTHARNPRSSATGLMQIMWSVWGPEYGFTQEELEVPEINLWVARRVYEIQGWNAWMCWRR